MTFKVRDLMIDVVPAGSAGHQLNLCQPDTAAGPKAPPPPPKEPACQPITMNTPVAQAGDFAPDTAKLASLAVLREQLHQALHT
jgi:hypothetical protein